MTRGTSCPQRPAGSRSWTGEAEADARDWNDKEVVRVAAVVMMMIVRMIEE